MVKASVSQSVGRAINVLEVFEQHRRPLTRAEIGEALGAPRSSVAALVQGLAELGILEYDQRTSTYMPGFRIYRLTRWIETALGFNDALREACRLLRDSTRETVTLTTPIGGRMEIVLSEQGLNPISYVVQLGETFPLWQSAVGAAYLSTLDDETIAAIHRGNRKSNSVMTSSQLEGVMQTVNDVRRKGYALMVGAVTSEVAGLAMPLPADTALRPLVLTVAGPGERIVAAEEAYARALRRAIGAVSGSFVGR